MGEGGGVGGGLEVRAPRVACSTKASTNTELYTVATVRQFKLVYYSISIIPLYYYLRFAPVRTGVSSRSTLAVECNYCE